MRDLGVAPAIVQAVQKHYVSHGVKPLLEGIQYCLPFDALAVAEGLYKALTFSVELVRGLCSYHSLMESNPCLSEGLIAVLRRFPLGTVLPDRVGHFWVRRAKTVVTRHRFISSVARNSDPWSSSTWSTAFCLTTRGRHVPQFYSSPW